MSQNSPPRLKRLIVKGFKSLVDVDIHFSPLTILVGANAAGKSNTLGALRFLRDALVFDLRQAIEMRGGFASILYGGKVRADSEITLVADLELDGKTFVYGFIFGLDPLGVPVVESEWFGSLDSQRAATGPLDFHRNGDVWRHTPSMLKHVPRVHPGTLALPLLASLEDAATPIALKFMQAMKFFNILPDMTRRPQRGAQGAVYELLSEDGHNLGPALLSLRHSRPNEFANGVMGPLAGVLPAVTDIEFDEVGAYVVTKLVRPGATTKALDLSSESYGTLLLLGNLVALRQPEHVSLVAIEEPENALHPAASRILAEAIIEASVNRQVLITTHSPDLLDSFAESAILVVDNHDGQTRVGPLAESQRQAIREHLFHAGELMRMEGLRRDDAPSSHA